MPLRKRTSTSLGRLIQQRIISSLKCASCSNSVARMALWPENLWRRKCGRSGRGWPMMFSGKLRGKLRGSSKVWRARNSGSTTVCFCQASTSPPIKKQKIKIFSLLMRVKGSQSKNKKIKKTKLMRMESPYLSMWKVGTYLTSRKSYLKRTYCFSK